MHHYTAARIRSGDLAPSLCLDDLPYRQLKPFIRAVQVAALQPGDCLAIEFTVLSPAITFLSDCFFLCAVPFIPTRQLPADAPYYVTRSPMSTPLLASLYRVLDLLISGPAPLVICSIHNLSEKFAAQLQDDIKTMEQTPALRKVVVENIGMDNWRWLNLMTNWKAGLLATRKISTWVIIVKKPL